MTAPTARLRLWGTLPAQYEADEIVAGTVDADGRIIALVATGRSLHLMRPYQARIVVVGDDAQVTETDIEELTFSFPMIDALGDGFVIADARNRNQRSRSELQHSARILAADGSTRLTFNTGDAIEQLLTDRTGAIWISYFDESSILAPRSGNAPSPGAGTIDVSPAGLIRWTEDGEPAWFAAFDPQRNTFWLDVYALNVGLRRAWACPYTGFPLVEIGPTGISSSRSTPVRGARGLAVAGPRVAFLGSYDDRQLDTITITFARLDQESVEVEATTPLLMPDGSPAVGRAYPMVCRDHRVWMQLEDPREWYVLEI